MEKQVKQFVLTCIESKEYKAKGKCAHSYGGFLYMIENIDGVPTVVDITADTSKLMEKFDYEIIVRR